MNTKLIVLLGSVGVVHLVAGGLFLAGGCAQEDPPMPPGIYVPKQPAQEVQVQNQPAPGYAAGQADLSAGSAYTPEPVPPPEPAARPAKPAKRAKKAKVSRAESRGEKVYIAVKNDSLWLIARKHGLTIEELASYNDLSPKARLRVGQKLYIPATGSKAVRGAQKKHKEVKGSEHGKKAGRSGRKTGAKPAKQLPPDGIYTVREYDSFSVIAKRYGIRVSDIIAANPGVESSRLKIGQKIRLVPGAAAVEKKSAAKKPAKSAAKKPAKKSSASKAAKKSAAKPEAKKPAAEASAPAAPAADPAPAAPAADPAPAAPASEANDKAADDPEALLNNVKAPDEKKPAQDSEAAVVPDKNNPLSVVPDKDRMIKGANGSLDVIIGEDTTLNAFCKKYTVSESVIRNQNQALPRDAQLKAGMRIVLMGADEVI